MKIAAALVLTLAAAGASAAAAQAAPCRLPTAGTVVAGTAGYPTVLYADPFALLVPAATAHPIALSGRTVVVEAILSPAQEVRTYGARLRGRNINGTWLVHVRSGRSDGWVAGNEVEAPALGAGPLTFGPRACRA